MKPGKLKNQSIGLFVFMRDFFVVAPVDKVVPFESVKKKFKLTNDVLDTQYHHLIFMGRFLLFLGVLIVLYMVYQMIYGSWLVVVVTLVIEGLAMVLSFRYYFWAFLIKQHRLDCTITEWWQHDVWGRP